MSTKNSPSLSLGTVFKFPIILCNVNTMRKKVFGKARIKKVKPKDFVKQQIPLIVPNYKLFEKLTCFKL